MGAGQEGGWAGVFSRSRGEHDFGLGDAYNFAPNAMLGMQAGQLDANDNDDYPNNGDPSLGNLCIYPS